MSLWKQISLGFLIFVISLTVVVAFLVGTTSGLHLLFNATNRWVPGLEIGHFSGNLFNLNLSKIRYQKLGVVIYANKFHLAMKLSCLLDKKLCIKNLSLTNVNIAIDSKKILPFIPVKDDINTLTSISIPYPMTFYQIELKNVNVRLDNTTVSLMDCKTGFLWQENTLTLMPTSLQGLLITLPRVGNVVKKKIIDLKMHNLKMKEKPLGKILQDFFSKPILPKMTDICLPLNLNIEEFKGQQLHLAGYPDLTISNMLMKISIIDGNVKLNVLNIETNKGAASITGNILLRDSWPVNIILNSTLNVDPLRGESIKIIADGALGDRLALNINLFGPINMILNGKIWLAEAGLPLNLELISKECSWPFTGKKQLQANSVKMILNGKITDYILSFQTAIKSENMPEAVVALNAHGNEQQINLNSLTVMALQGRAELRAVVNWQKAISWHGDLKLTGINTEKTILHWPSRLDGLIKICGYFYSGYWQFEVPEINLTSNLRHHKIKISGVVKSNNYFQRITPTLKVAIDRNSATDISNIKEIRKKINDMNDNGLRWTSLLIDRILLVDRDVNSIKNISGTIELYVKHIAKSGKSISLLALSAKGNEKQHNLHLRIHNNLISGYLHLNGSFDRQSEQWKGRLYHTRFSTPVGSVRLSRAIMLDYRNAKQKISIGSHCWINENTELCIPQTIEVGIKGSVLINLNHFDLSMMTPFTSNVMKTSGIISGKAKIIWDATKKGLLQSSTTLTFYGHEVKIATMIHEVPLGVAFDTLNLNAYLNDNRVKLCWLIQMSNHNGQIEGFVQLNDLKKWNHLSGSVKVRNLNFSIANEIFSHGKKASGKLNTDLILVGNVQQYPHLFGEILLDNVDIDSNFIPFCMQPSQLKINFNGTNATMKGEIYTLQGKINLTGRADWRQISRWYAYVSVKSSRVRLSVPPIMQLDVSSDVEIEITPSLFTLKGTIDVPWARIIVHDMLENIVDISSDEVLLDKNLNPLKQKDIGIQINNNLTLHLGNDVRLEAFGLKTRLTGDLKVTQDRNGLGVNGKINLSEGRFHTYGQDLVLRKGEILFSGPLDQPVLNIEAIHNPDDMEDNVIAGVRITGSTNEPTVEIFSNPVMPQQEALSYLLRGKGLSGNQTDDMTMTSILVGLEVVQSERIISKIGKIFGISNLSLDTQGIGDSSQIVISGYVLPELQVKYGIGIFNSVSTLMLRYRLIPKLYLEVISGMNQALDLLYQFEF